MPSQIPFSMWRVETINEGKMVSGKVLYVPHIYVYVCMTMQMFKRKADEIATALLPAFRTPTGIPYALVVPKT